MTTLGIALTIVVSNIGLFIYGMASGSGLLVALSMLISYPAVLGAGVAIGRLLTVGGRAKQKRHLAGHRDRMTSAITSAERRRLTRLP